MYIKEKNIFISFLILITTTIITFSSAFYITYLDTISQHTVYLNQIADTNLSFWIEIFKKDNISSNMSVDDIRKKVISYSSTNTFGKTGEVIIGVRESSQIRLLLPTIYSHGDELQSIDNLPMKMAFKGDGITWGVDYNKQDVLAAYRQVDGTDFGLVAKINYSEIISPFIKSAFIMIITSCAIIFTGIVLIIVFLGPIFRDHKIYKEAKACQENVFQYAPIGLATVNQKGLFLDVNPELCRMLGYSKEDLLNKTFQDITHPDDLQEDLNNVSKLLSGELLCYRMEKRYLKKDGSYTWIQLDGSIANYDPIIFIAQIQDISETKKLIKDLRNSNEQLESFAYAASHDLREPLRSIAGFSELIRKKIQNNPDTDEKILKHLCFVQEGVENMSQVIDDLLIYSQLGKRIQASQCNINDIINNVEFSLSQQISENNAKITKSDFPVISAYQAPLVQIFQNLISNAIKYRSILDPEIEIGFFDENFEYKFWIKDNGTGINKKYHDQIFQLFSRLGERDGTGAGLAIVKKAVELHGGSIWVHSEETKGSTFFFTILKGLK